MRTNRALQLGAAFLAVILFSNLLSFTTKNNRFSESYPAVVCAPNLSGQSSAISLTSTKAKVRKTGTSTLKYKDARTYRYTGSSQASVIDAQTQTPIAWQVRSGVWGGATTCIAPASSQWFVGATADLTSKGTLLLVNSGLGRALVGVTVYSESGVQAEQLFDVKANSFKAISLTALAPGSKSIAILVKPQTGRVNAFVNDERGRGLQALGGDTVNSIASPANELVIPAIPQQSSARDSAAHVMRVLVPGEIGATLKVEIRSADGVFSPAGADGRLIPAGKVVDIPLKVLMKSGQFALYISADRPIVASVWSKTLAQGKSDFLWSTAVPPLGKSTYAVSGLAPTVVFTGGEIAVDLELTLAKGVRKKVQIRATDIATYRASDRVRAITILKSSKNVYAAALITSKSGSGYAPLRPGSELTRTSIPRSNIRVLIP